MDLFQEILIKALQKEEMTVLFPNLETNVAELVERECFDALHKIKAVIENDSLNDFECVEKIVCIFEVMGSNGGNRHDFG